MNWLFYAGIFATGLIASAQEAQLPGTCASISYSTTCCPPDANCQAMDGDCYCNANCHTYGDCCADVQCLEYPRTCAEVGITTCCNDESDTGLCDVNFRDSQNNRCSCNISCHLRNDCCSDAVAIGCSPRTCTEAGKNPGCCLWSSGSSCFVSSGGCYCDSYCSYFNDCCEDVSRSATYQCGLAQLARSREQIKLEKEQKTSTIQRFNENDRRTQRIHNANARSSYQRERILSSISQRQHMNAKEFRGRHRIAG